jgi:Zn finger protein HypA/HybF involved in hydrogenase expression
LSGMCERCGHAGHGAGECWASCPTCSGHVSKLATGEPLSTDRLNCGCATITCGSSEHETQDEIDSLAIIAIGKIARSTGFLLWSERSDYTCMICGQNEAYAENFKHSESCSAPRLLVASKATYPYCDLS